MNIVLRSGKKEIYNNPHGFAIIERMDQLNNFQYLFLCFSPLMSVLSTRCALFSDDSLENEAFLLHQPTDSAAVTLRYMAILPTSARQINYNVSLTHLWQAGKQWIIVHLLLPSVEEHTYFNQHFVFKLI